MTKNSRDTVTPRVAWNHESKDYIPWLAENLDLLGGVAGMELGSPQREKMAGRFRADLLVSEVSTGRTVLIETQLAKSNHDHLGKCLTYAAWHGIDTIIWIAPTFTNEHIGAVKALNGLSSLRLYAVVFDFVQSGRVYTPKFSVVCYPTGAYSLVHGWTKHAALARLHMNAKAQESLVVEPLLQEILDEAIQQERCVGYDRIRTYYALKRRCSELVGWDSGRYPFPSNAPYFDAVVSAIDDILPPDDLEVYGDFDDFPVERQRAWEEWEAQQEQRSKQ